MQSDTTLCNKHVCHLCKKNWAKIRAALENNVVYPFVCLPLAVEKNIEIDCIKFIFILGLF